MAKTLKDAQEQLEQERENPFKNALARLGFRTGTVAKSDDDDEGEDAFDGGADLDDDDDLFDGDWNGEAADDDDDDDDEDDWDDDEDEDEGVSKSQTAAVHPAEERAAKGKTKRAKTKRARDLAAPEARAGASRNWEHLGEGEDEGEDDWDDDDGDEGDADASNGGRETREANHGRALKSEDYEEEDYGEPTQEEFIAAVLASPYAQQIDASAALRETVNMFGSELAKERIILSDVAKSYEEIAQRIDALYEGMQVLAAALDKSLTLQGDIQKSLSTVATDVALVKSQPAGATPMGYQGQPPVRPDVTAPTGKTISKRLIHEELAKSVNSGELSAGEAADFMTAIDSPIVGIKGVYERLPEPIRARIDAR